MVSGGSPNCSDVSFFTLAVAAEPSESDPGGESELPFAAFNVVASAEPARNRHEAARGHIGAGVVEVGRVGQIVRLEPELKIRALSQAEIPE